MSSTLTLDLSALPTRQRERVWLAHARAVEDAELATAYDELVGEYGSACVLDEVAERFSKRWRKTITPSRVRVAKWGK